MRILVTIAERDEHACAEAKCAANLRHPAGHYVYTRGCALNQHARRLVRVPHLAHAAEVGPDGKGTGASRAAATRTGGRVLVLDTNLGAELAPVGRVPTSEETLEQATLRVGALAEKVRGR